MRRSPRQGSEATKKRKVQGADPAPEDLQALGLKERPLNPGCARASGEQQSLAGSGEESCHPHHSMQANIALLHRAFQRDQTMRRQWRAQSATARLLEVKHHAYGAAGERAQQSSRQARRAMSSASTTGMPLEQGWNRRPSSSACCWSRQAKTRAPQHQSAMCCDDPG